MKRTTLFLTILIIGTSSAVTQPFGYTPLQVLSLFNEEYRNEQYEYALPYGRWLVEEHPREMEEHPGNYRGDRNFSRMIDIYEHMAEQQSDPSLREAYIDSCLQMYDRVFALFGEDDINLYRWHFNRGRFLQEHSDYISNAYQRALDDYETMFNINPRRAVTSGDGFYIRLLVDNYAQLGDRDAAFSIINQAEPYADEATLEFFAEIRDEMITDPQERFELLSENLQENPECVETMHELYEICQAIGDSETAIEMATRMYEEAPVVENILRLADIAEEDGDYNVANRYLNEVHENQEGADRAETSLRIAENYLSLRELQNARSYALRAAREDQSWGQPYIVIAQIYGRAISQCVEGQMSRDDKSVYWLVLDYLDRAVQRDSGVERIVNRLYRTYEPVAPSAEDKFYRNWETGDTIYVNGSLDECYAWIDEETTVR